LIKMPVPGPESERSCIYVC